MNAWMAIREVRFDGICYHMRACDCVCGRVCYFTFGKINLHMQYVRIIYQV